MRAANNQRIPSPDLAERIADCLATLEATARATAIPVTGDGRVSEVAAASLLGMAAGTLRNWRNGPSPLPFYRASGRITYRLADLAAYIEKAREDW